MTPTDTHLAQLIQRSGMADDEKGLWLTLLPLMAAEEESHLELTLTAELIPNQ